MNKRIGFTIGKFAPFHKGHEFLINEAIKRTDELYIVVYDTPELNININKKIEWILNKFDNVKIIKAYNSPKEYGLDETSVKIQMNYLSNLLKNIPVTCFFSSEKYGEYVSKYLNIENVNVDMNRLNVPISATKIRNDIESNKGYLDDEVYQYIKNIYKKKD